MANVLNLALKKNIFDELTNFRINEIPIKKNDWWKKRLMDLDTGVFKKFDVACVSCGSSDKFNFEIDHIEERDKLFVVSVILPKISDNEDSVEICDSDFEPDDNPEDRANDEYIEEIIETEQINPEIIEPVTINPVIVNEDGSVIQKTTGVLSEEQKQAIIKRYTDKVKQELSSKQEPSDVRMDVMKLLDAFCKNVNVYVVNMPYVTIRNNGMIIGCNRRLLADKDSDVRIDFKKVEFTQYSDIPDNVFLEEIAAYMEEILKNNYVFINKNYCGFATSDFGENIFKMAVTPKKKYLFIKK